MKFLSSNCKHQKQPPEVFFQKGVLKNFPIFTGKHLCHSLFYNKVVGLKPETLLKRILWHRCFSVNLRNFSEHDLFIEHPPVAASESHSFTDIDVFHTPQLDFNRTWCFNHQTLWNCNSPSNFQGENIKKFWYRWYIKIARVASSI